MGTKIHVCPGLKKKASFGPVSFNLQRERGGGEEREGEGGDKMGDSSNILLH